MTAPGPTGDWARPVVHWEMRAADPDRQRAFYAALFSWTIGDGPFMDVAPGFGGPEPGPGGHIAAGEAPGITLYVQVRDLAETMAAAVELGGGTAFDPFDVPGGPTLAGITDPEGNQVVLVQE